MNTITSTLQHYIDSNEIAGAVLMVRKDGALVYDEEIGYADLAKSTPVKKDSIFRLCSMSKPINGVAVAQLLEKGKLSLSDKVSSYVPKFRDMKVCKKVLVYEEYVADPDNPTGLKALREDIETMTYVPAHREITILDLLNHSSGLGEGPVGMTLLDKIKTNSSSLLERAKMIASLPLDFQPGTRSAYSALASSEILSAIVEMVSGEEYEEYLRKHIFLPLGMDSLGFSVTSENQKRLVRLYEYKDGVLSDVTETDPSLGSFLYDKCGYKSAAAGLYGSVEDYERFAQMLLNRGSLDGVKILEPETVDMIHGKGIPHTSVMMPGTYWGLNMVVFEAPEKINRRIASNTYGWSGAFGTHFYVDPANHMDVVLGINRSNIGGADSYVSHAVERAVTDTFLKL